VSRFAYDVMPAAEFLALLGQVRDNPAQALAGVDVALVRRSAKMFAQPATIGEVRRVVSEVAARHGEMIDGHIPGNRLVDEVGNWSPNRLALELMKAAPPDRMPDFVQITRSASDGIQHVLGLVGVTEGRVR